MIVLSLAIENSFLVSFESGYIEFRLTHYSTQNSNSFFFELPFMECLNFTQQNSYRTVLHRILSYQIQTVPKILTENPVYSFELLEE
jgi:hypothetical protein